MNACDVASRCYQRHEHAGDEEPLNGRNECRCCSWTAGRIEWGTAFARYGGEVLAVNLFGGRKEVWERVDLAQGYLINDVFVRCLVWCYSDHLLLMILFRFFFPLCLIVDTSRCHTKHSDVGDERRALSHVLGNAMIYMFMSEWNACCIFDRVSVSNVTGGRRGFWINWIHSAPYYTFGLQTTVSSFSKAIFP